jgi:hypothetical protein
MRIASIGHAAFAITMIALGIVGFLRPDFVPLWNPVPMSAPTHRLVIYLGALISLVAGGGLLVQRTAAISARVLLTTLLLWLLLFRLTNFLHVSLFEASWSVFPLLVMVAGAWILYVWLAGNWDRKHLSFITGDNALCVARSLYGLSPIFFGSAHFIDLEDTLSLIPNWLSGHLFWAYFTGAPSSRRASRYSWVTVQDWQPRFLPCKSQGSCFWYGYPSWQQAPKSLPVERDHP